MKLPHLSGLNTTKGRGIVTSPVLLLGLLEHTYNFRKWFIETGNDMTFIIDSYEFGPN